MDDLVVELVAALEAFGMGVMLQEEADGVGGIDGRQKSNSRYC